MQEKISTSTLMRRMFKANDLGLFLEKNQDQMQTDNFCETLRELTDEHGLTPARAVERSSIDRTYGHQLYNGTRKPSRDKVIQLAAGLTLTVEETQRLLRAAEKSVLYPRIRRDAIILYGIRKKMGVVGIQELLSTYGATLLGGQTSDRE